MRTPWTTREVAILSSGLSIRALSKLLGRSEQAIRNAAQRHGAQFARSTNTKVSAEDVAQIMMLRDSGWTWRQIASAKSMTAEACKAVTKRAKKYGFDKYPKRVIN